MKQNLLEQQQKIVKHQVQVKHSVVMKPRLLEHQVYNEAQVFSITTMQNEPHNISKAKLLSEVEK